MRCCRFIRQLLAILLVVAADTSSGQDESISSTSRLITSIPFTTFNGGVVVVRAMLSNYPDTLNFIMDTGSGGISLDSMTCVRMHIHTEPSDKTIRGIAGIQPVNFIYHQQLRLSDLTVDSLDFNVCDYGILTSVYGDRIDGIIGFSFFSRYIVYIDYDSSRIYLYSKGRFKYPKGGFLLRPSLVKLPVESAHLQDAASLLARFYFDTGAGLCLLLSTDFVVDSNLLNAKKTPLNTQAEGLGGKANMKVTTLREFKLGPYKFHHVPTYIYDDVYNITSYPYLGGLIGNDILRRFNTILNYNHRDIYLIPNSHYRDPFDYSYTGLGIYWIDGLIRVGDVMKGSPAEKAGFKVDDVIIAVNTNISNNIQAYKNLMQNVGEKVKIIIRRGNSFEELSMRVISIL